MLQSLTVEELHRDVRPVVGLADFVNGANIRVIQGRSGPRLPAEALQRLGITSQILGQKLQRNKPPQLGVLGLIHDSHPAATELLDDAIMRDGLADHWLKS